MINEKQFRRMIVQIIESVGGHVSMIESPELSPGAPDLNWCIRGMEGWTELKVSKKGEAPNIRKTQRAWIRRRVQAGGRVNLLCYYNPKDTIIMLAGECLEDVKTMKDWLEYGEQTVMSDLSDILSDNLVSIH